MGKVKLGRRGYVAERQKVSIPYGKGKAGRVTKGQHKFVYQFPMGKVKIVRMKIKKNMLKRINSLWER